MKKAVISTPITYRTRIENANKWLSIVRFGESGTVIQLQDDCEYRVLEVIEDKKIVKSILGPYFRKYILKYLPVDQKDLQKAIRESLIESCLERKISSENKLKKLSPAKILTEIAQAGFEVGLFISHVTPLLRKKDFQPLIDLELLIRTSKNVSVIFFSEQDITHKKYTILTDKASFLFDHILYYPLYDEKDSLQFIHFYSEKWKYPLNETSSSEVIQRCGGYLWLIHQALRSLRDNQASSIQDAFTHELMLKKIETIWTKFTDEEKNIIRKIIFGSLREADTLTHAYHYLIKMRVVLEKKNKVYLGIPLLSYAIEKENKLNELQTKDNRVLVGEKDISGSLSKKEKEVLGILLSAKKKVVSRDTIAQALWGNDWEEKYTDWALDRLMYRLRKKLQKLCIDATLLKTIKKKGFIFG